MVWLVPINRKSFSCIDYTPADSLSGCRKSNYSVYFVGVIVSSRLDKLINSNLLPECFWCLQYKDSFESAKMHLAPRNKCQSSFFIGSILADVFRLKYCLDWRSDSARQLGQTPDQTWTILSKFWTDSDFSTRQTIWFMQTFMYTTQFIIFRAAKIHAFLWIVLIGAKYVWNTDKHCSTSVISQTLFDF